MELKQLYGFVTVVKEGTISGAARKLNLSQPPLSAQMKQLEEEFGCLLFERGPRKIVLTEAGRLLYERAVTMLELADVTRKELFDCRDGVTGALRLGVVSSVGSSLLPEWMKEFHAQNPAVRFELFEANTYQLLEQLHANLLELAIVRTPFEAENLVSFPLCRETLLAAGDRKFFSETERAQDDASSGTADISLKSAGLSSDAAEVSPKPAGLSSADADLSPDAAEVSPSGKRREISLSQLSGLPLILYRRWEKPLAEAAAQDGLSLTCFCLNDDARTTARLADCGLGVGVIPASSRGFLKNPRTRVLPIRDARLASSILAVHAKTARLSAVARLFLSYLQTRAEISS